MRRAHVVSTAFLALIATSAVTVQAQDGGKKPAPPAPSAQQPRVSPAEQQQRVQQQQQRTTQLKQHLDQQVHVVQQQTTQLQQQKRTAQVRVQQQYQTHLVEQQRQLQAPRNFTTDPYVTTPHNYRYVVSGAARETNQYGVDMLRQAVNDGYSEGVRAGEADRTDHWKSDYQAAPAYQDATYGYSGQYVDQSDYSYYFRQGFQRGYADGYNARSQYGSVSNGNYSILGSLLTSILGLTSIH
jgi:hypothetical protein